MISATLGLKSSPPARCRARCSWPILSWTRRSCRPDAFEHHKVASDLEKEEDNKQYDQKEDHLGRISQYVVCFFADDDHDYPGHENNHGRVETHIPLFEEPGRIFPGQTGTDHRDEDEQLEEVYLDSGGEEKIEPL